MKLSLVTETFPPEINGVALTFGHLVRELTRRGHALTVYRPWRPDLTTRPPIAGCTEVPVTGVPIPFYPQLRLGLPAPLAFRRRWQKERPDLVHVATEGPLGASAIGAARALGLPVSSSFHTNFHTYAADYGIAALRPIAVSWLRWVHNRTLCTFAPTDELCNELRQLGFSNLRLLSRGVDTTLFSPSQRSAELRARWGAGPDDPVVVHTGRMAAEKNYPLLFRIYEAMRAANPRCRFVLVGDGPLREALQRRHPEFRFVGFVPRDELARHYASADIYVHASLTETFGNVVTEALASGLAVAGFDYAAARQFIRQGVSGLTVPRTAPDALTDAAVALATSTALRERLRSHARPAVLAQSWDHVISRFEADLHELIATHAAARARPGTPPPSAERAPGTAH